MTDNDNLMITRGRYITFVEEQKKLNGEVKALKPTIEKLNELLENDLLDSDSSQQTLYESSITITKLSEIYAKLRENKIEIDRLKPMTGF